ncbi:hypothetical protein [Comamonas sp. JC664]|uniref:hypothetical protein n=1 Tax=Comamonas sp. JC664 TaxID=2801917 RepID=UPI00174E1735|nr:hypothetical protein [Comamonas sp. JC664]MBL0697431.1 hypothetical protein [Comamonas sp. JC664]GHG67675.1 hypothetical protein GCM10012319_10190 [Comamonas sp. KCTC 72670]
MNPLLRRNLLHVPAGAVVAVGLLSGCGSSLTSEVVDLASMADRTLALSQSDVDVFEGLDEPGSHRVTVTFSSAAGGSCTELREGVTATFNGLPMTLERGGVDGTAGRDVCVPTRAYYDFDPNIWEREPTEDARIVLQDGTHTITLVTKGGKAKRFFSFQGPGSEDRLTRGQPYAFRWMPEGEVPGPITATLLRAGGLATATVPTTQDEGTVNFSLLQTTPVAVHLLTLSGTAPGTVLECTGVAGCSAAVFHSEERVVNVQ